MSDRILTVPQMNKIVRKYIIKWKHNLFLGSYLVNFNIRDYINSDNDGYSTCATCDSQWQYLEATINFSHLKMKEMTDNEIEKIVIHEMMHIIVNEMREKGIDHEERVVSHLQMVMSWNEKKGK